MNDMPEWRVDQARRYIANLCPSGVRDYAEALEAENKRLREALSDMVVVAEKCEWDKALTGRDLILRAARAALAHDQPASDERHGDQPRNQE